MSVLSAIFDEISRASSSSVSGMVTSIGEQPGDMMDLSVSDWDRRETMYSPIALGHVMLAGASASIDSRRLLLTLGVVVIVGGGWFDISMFEFSRVFLLVILHFDLISKL